MNSTVSVDTVTPSFSLVDWALAYARAGYKVFPINPDHAEHECREKTCRGKDCNECSGSGCKCQGKTPLGLLVPRGFHDATLDATQIQAWWHRSPRSNIGIACEASGILAIDLDTHKVDENGLETFKQLKGANSYPETPTQCTPGGISGGLHQLFKHPPGVKVRGKIASGFEVKSRGYIVAAPSQIHGKPYAWLEGCSLLDKEPAVLPGWLHSLIANSVTTKADMQFTNAPRDADEQALLGLTQEIEKERLRSAAQFLQPDRAAWVKYCFALKRDGYSFEFFHELCQLWPDYAGEPDCLRQWNTSNPNGDATVGSIYHDAKQAGWESPSKYGLPPKLEQRWANFDVPGRFELTGEGLSQWCFIKGVKSHLDPICDPIAVTAKTRGVDGEAMGGLILEVLTLDKTVREIAIPRNRLHQDGRLLAQDLASLNFRITPGKEQPLLVFINACTPSAELIAVGRTGWASAEANQENLVFVFPDKATDPGYRYQPERWGSNTTVHESGTLNDWIEQVYTRIRHNQYCLYEVFKSLSAPLQKFASVDTGEHLHGRTTSGKTTLAQVGASVWGCGADPSKSPEKSYIRRWNTTANALEGLLCQHNDLPVYFDELGTFGGDNFGNLVYNATGGTGKAAMDTSRNLKQPRVWQTLITSTGEISMLSRIEEASHGRKNAAKGGQVLRIIDREIGENTFANAQEVDAVKRGCSQFYGTLGTAFIAKLVDAFTVSTLHATVRELLDKATRRLLSGRPKFGAIQQRALARFALAEVAGELLASSDLIPGLTYPIVTAAIDKVVRDWEPASQHLSDEDRAIKALREFILTNRDIKFKQYGFRESFQAPNGQPMFVDVPMEKVYRELAGFVDTANHRVLMFPQSIQEATGLDAKLVAKELDRRGLLVREPARPNRLQCRARIDGEQVSMYAISSALLGEGERQLSWDDLI